MAGVAVGRAGVVRAEGAAEAAEVAVERLEQLFAGGRLAEAVAGALHAVV